MSGVVNMDNMISCSNNVTSLSFRDSCAACTASSNLSPLVINHIHSASIAVDASDTSRYALQNRLFSNWLSTVSQLTAAISMGPPKLQVCQMNKYMSCN